MILHADARALPLVAGCVDCVVTSPPYWGLRDYGHVGQLGLESTPDAYVAALVAVFREVARVLKPAGTVWLNLGDSYNSSSQNNHGKAGPMPHRHLAPVDGWAGHRPNAPGLANKNLVGIPWRVAFALQADGWYLRSDIIWHKPNPMPESVTDRPTKAHEYLFLLTRSERYWYDGEAIKEPSVDRESYLGRNRRNDDKFATHDPNGYARTRVGFAKIEAGRLFETRNARSVWTIPTLPYAGAHFATMPEALVEPCILAGCPLGGLVLDPFLGSGTVGAVAERLGRRWVGTDLAYHDLSTARTAQRGLRFEGATPGRCPNASALQRHV